MNVGFLKLKQKQVRWLLGTAVCVLLLLFVALPPLIKYFLVQGLSDKFQREVSVEHVSFNPLTLTLQIQGLSIANRDGGELAGFDDLTVNLSAASFFQYAIVVDGLHLHKPRLLLRLAADGSYDIADLLAQWRQPDDPSSGSVPRFSLNNLKLSAGQLVFEDQLRQKRHQVESIDVALPFISSLPYQAEIHVQPMLAATVNGSRWQLDGEATPFAEGRQSALNLHLTDFDLAWLQAYLPANLPLQLVSARLDSRLSLVFRELPEGSRSLQLSGQVGIHDLSLMDTLAKTEPLLSWKSLVLDFAESDLLARKLSLRSVLLDGSVLNVAVNRRGELNLLNLQARLQQLSTDDATRADEVRETAAKEPGIDWSLDAFELRDSVLRWQDASSVRPVRGEIRQLQLRTGGLNAALSEPLKVLEAQAQLDFGQDLQVDRINLQGLSVDLAGQRVDLESLHSGTVRVRMQRGADGQLLWLSAPKLRQPAVSNSARKASSRPWLAQLARLEVADLALDFNDETVKPAAKHQISGFKLTAERLGNVPNSTGQLQLETVVNQRGKLNIAGDLQLVPFVTSLKVESRAVPLRALQAYLNPHLNVEIQQGLFSNQGLLRARLNGGDFQSSYQGSLTLGQFLAVDPENRSDFLKWKSLHLGGVALRLMPLDIEIRDIALSDFYSRLILNEAGKLNLANLIRQPPTDAAQEDEATPPVPLRIGKITLNNGTVDFRDDFIKPNYAVQIAKLGGQVSGLSSVDGTQADMELRGTYGAAAPVLITARLNPLAAQSYLDLQGEVQGIDLTGFSPYSGKYAGHVIDKGALSLKVAYKLENRRLSADNHVFIDQLTLGERVDSPDATRLPVNLAIALLRNNRGEIDLNLPLAGSLDDPEFSLGGLIVKVVVNLFVKAVTSPFALLGSMFGGGEELSSVAFAPGEMQVDATVAKTLATLAKALTERGGLKLEISGFADPETDREGLKQLALRQAVAQEKRLELIKQGKEDKEDSADNLARLAISSEEYPRLLARVYQAAKFPKPRNAIGLSKTLPVDEMEKLWLANWSADDEALRRLARQRAEAVRLWLIEEGKVPAGRLFLVAPKGGQDGPPPGRRVEFALR